MPDTQAVAQVLAQIGADIKEFADQASADLIAGAASLTPQQQADGVAFVGQLRTLQGDVAAAGMVTILAGAEADLRDLRGGTAQLKTVLQQVQAAAMQFQFLAIWVPAVGAIVAALGKADLGTAFSSFQDASKAWGKVVHPEAAATANAPAAAKDAANVVDGTAAPAKPGASGKPGAAAKPRAAGAKAPKKARARTLTIAKP